jgi:CMP-N,N'-diacetyllegionaminic acid synthase
MKILAIVPARSGSKRLPGKNIKILGDKPLIAWTIECAKKIHDICDVIVSTDSIEIADVAKQYGATVPFIRPIELSTDTASSVDVMLHALEEYEKKEGFVDGVMLLQPTSPFRSINLINRGIKKYQENNKRTIVGVSPVRDHPEWVMKKKGDLLVPYIAESQSSSRSQDLPEAFVVNGCFYLIDQDLLKKTKKIVSSEFFPLIVNSMQESLDIDDQWDWNIAQMIAASK